jgi:hypothetical protein
MAAAEPADGNRGCLADQVSKTRRRHALVGFIFKGADLKTAVRSAFGCGGSVSS